MSTTTKSIEVHDWAWPIYKPAIRDLRVILRKAGCTSRLTRKGVAVTLTASGPSMYVAPVMASFLEFGKQAAAMQKKAAYQPADMMALLMSALRGTR